MKKKKEAFTIKDVHGNDIKTNDGYNRMRQQLEMHIGANRHIEVINTTKVGAQIEGTSFKDLDDLINEKFIVKTVLQGWSNNVNTYNMDYTEERLQLLKREEKIVGSSCKVHWMSYKLYKWLCKRNNRELWRNVSPHSISNLLN